jgi:hypothetical protein
LLPKQKGVRDEKRLENDTAHERLSTDLFSGLVWIDLVWFMNLMLGVTMLLGLCIGAITMSIKGVLVGFLSPLVSCIAMVYVYNTIRPLWGSADLSLPILLILIIFVWFTVPVAILHVAEWFQGLWSKFAAGTTSPR